MSGLPKVAIRIAVAVLLLGLLVGGGFAVAIFAAALSSYTGDSSTTAAGDCTTAVTGLVTSSSLGADQIANARTIISVGLAMGVPQRGEVIAVATALQESTLVNLPDGDRDSVGLFQQRPSVGWGTAAELTTPSIAASRFYTALLAVPGWASMALTQAAQAVQRSAFPLAYAKWEPLATSLVTGGPGGRPLAVTITCSQSVGISTPPGAVGDMLRAALAQQGKPYVWGATGPDAFDCSGLVVYSWRSAGFVVGVRTSEQMWARSTPVPPGQEQPGDLIFGEFGPSGPGHVMIVVRPGLAIQAPHTGDVVRLTPYRIGPGWRLGRLDPTVLTAVPVGT